MRCISVYISATAALEAQIRTKSINFILQQHQLHDARSRNDTAYSMRASVTACVQALQCCMHATLLVQLISVKQCCICAFVHAHRAHYRTICGTVCRSEE
jgi:methylmalonyl-CoA mutase N-terminal domain/subunit